MSSSSYFSLLITLSFLLQATLTAPHSPFGGGGVGYNRHHNNQLYQMNINEINHLISNKNHIQYPTCEQLRQIWRLALHHTSLYGHYIPNDGQYTASMLNDIVKYFAQNQHSRQYTRDDYFYGDIINYPKMVTMPSTVVTKAPSPVYGKKVKTLKEKEKNYPIYDDIDEKETSIGGFDDADFVAVGGGKFGPILSGGGSGPVAHGDESAGVGGLWHDTPVTPGVTFA